MGIPRVTRDMRRIINTLIPLLGVIHCGRGTTKTFRRIIHTLGCEDLTSIGRVTGRIIQLWGRLQGHAAAAVAGQFLGRLGMISLVLIIMALLKMHPLDTSLPIIKLQRTAL